MNDFTKDELDILAQAVYYLWKDIPKDIPVDISALPNKIQSLIDNYCEPCEHKWLNMAYAYYQCDKCFARKGFHE